MDILVSEFVRKSSYCLSTIGIKPIPTKSLGAARVEHDQAGRTMTSSEVVGAARNSADFGAGDAGSSRPIVPGPAGSMSSPSGQMALANYNTPTLPSAQEQEREDMLRFQPLDRQQSAIRLRRLRRPTLPSRLGPVEPIGEASDRDTTQRRRSSSEPHRPPPSAATVPGPTALPSVSEVPATRRQGTDPALVALPQGIRIPGRRRQTLQNHGMTEPLDMDCYDSRIVDFLDVVGKSSTSGAT